MTDPQPPMSTEEAGAVVLGFGKYRGQALRDIARDDEGLRWLDWAVGVLRPTPHCPARVIKAIETMHAAHAERIDGLVNEPGEDDDDGG